MLTIKDLQDVLTTVTYKDNFTLSAFEPDPLQGPYILILVTTEDSNESKATVLRIASPIPPMFNYEEFYRWLIWRLKMVEIHECMEFFKVDNQVYLDPHRPM